MKAEFAQSLLQPIRGFWADYVLPGNANAASFCAFGLFLSVKSTYPDVFCAALPKLAAMGFYAPAQIRAGCA